ncbi:cation:proton antiporter [Pseudonocardia sp. S2-4]|uniref:Cation:proton antiporter n=2 Tax=Pseudonocardia humida TaxID=2800819 RepID=A0ABT0ZUU2_9PSEU|nr:cation:proton antiporter [Pseudonocardia humida]
MGRLFLRLGQPAVIGEIVAGIALGPTLLGLLPGDLDALLFPTEVRPHLSVIAQLGLALFMFIVGLEVDLGLIRGRGRAAGTVATGAMVLPLVLGAAVALVLYPHHDTNADGEPIPQLAFVLFLGVAMSITALPVLARILTERRMHRIPTGVLALACAVIDDVLGWTLLAVVVAVAAGGSPAGVGWIMGMTALFVLVMFVVVRPLLARMVAWHRQAGRLTPDMLAVVLAGLLLSAWVTDLIGVHAIFGAFLFGAIMPRRDAGLLTRDILERLEQVSLSLLLPVFFVVAGLQVDVGGIGPDGVWQLGLILLAAIGGKVLGTAGAARWQRLPRRQQWALGLLMNTRGLTEIVILQVGLQLGVLTPTMFTLMVLMALITTAMTGPLVRRLYPDRVLDRELAALEAAEQAALGGPESYTVLVAVPEDPAAARRTAQLARELTGREEPARVVLCRLLAPAAPLEVAGGMGAELAVLAQVGDELRALAAELSDAGTTASVVVRFAADPAADLAALAARLDADVVLLVEEPTAATDDDEARGAESAGSGNASRLQALDAVPEVTVVVADAGAEPAGTRVGVVVDGGAGGRAAVRVGAQLALHTGADLAVAPVDRRRARRSGAAVAALARRGIPAEGVDDPAGAGLLVLPVDLAAPDATGASAVLRVRAAAADADDDVEQVVERIEVGAPSQA